MGKLAKQLGGQSQVKVADNASSMTKKKVTNMKKGGSCGCAAKKMKCGGSTKKGY